MNRSLKTLTLAAVLVLCAVLLPLHRAEAARSGTCGTNLTWELDDEGNLTIRGTGAMGAYNYSSTLPWGTSIRTVTIEEGVTYIGEWNFNGCSGLKQIIIPDSVRYIGGSAFYGCSSLTEVIIPDSVRYIGGSAFYGCSSLTEVTIPDSVTSIGSGAFYRCSSLTEVTIPDSVTSIGDSAFDGCSSLRSIHVAENNSNYCSLNGVLFSRDMSELLQYPDGRQDLEYVIPENITSIGDYAFTGCSGLKQITMPDSVVYIGYRAFYYCSGLTEVTIGSSVSSIGSYAFSGCSGLTEITIPDSVSSIGDWTFSGCSGLTQINIPDGVTSIGSYAFYLCSGITTITIPDSVTSIGDYAFDGCSGLIWVHYLGEEERWNGVAGYGKNSLPSGKLFFGDVSSGACGENLSYSFDPETGALTVTGSGAMTDYPSAAPWATFGEALHRVSVPEGLTSVGKNAFHGCSGLESISLGDNVEAMGENAFLDCPLLKTAGPTGGGYDIEFAWRRTVPDNAFNGANCLESVTLPGSLLKLGDRAFYGCSRLEDLKIPDGLEIIGSNVITGCAALDSLGGPGSGCRLEIPWTDSFLRAFLRNNRNLKNVVLPESLTEIGNSLFYGCSGLSSYTIPRQITKICDYAFYGCSGLTQLTIPDSVTSIGSYAFQGCSGLTQVTIGSGVSSIGSSAFQGCSNLTSVVFPTGLRGIGNYAFSGCSALRRITLPSGLTGLGSYAFQGCSALESVTLLGYTGIVDGVFQNCTGLREVRFSNGVSSIGSSAFSGCRNLRKVWLPRSVKAIAERAFYDCEKLDDVYYSGSEENWTAMDIGAYNSFLTTAEIHYDEDPVWEANTGFLEVSRKTQEGQQVYEVSVWCDPWTAATAYGARYSADGQFLGVTMLSLAPGEDNLLTVPCEDGTLVRIFALDSGTCAPLTASLNLAS